MAFLDRNFWSKGGKKWHFVHQRSGNYSGGSAMTLCGTWVDARREDSQDYVPRHFKCGGCIAVLNKAMR